MNVAKYLAVRSGIDLCVSEGLLHGVAWEAHRCFWIEPGGRTRSWLGSLAVQMRQHSMSGGGECQDGLMYPHHHLQTYLGLRPARSLASLFDRTPFRRGWAERTNMLILPEMCGAAMFATDRSRRIIGGVRQCASRIRHDRL